MARALRRLKGAAGALPLLLLWALPLCLSLAMALASAVHAEAWAALFDHPQLWPATWLSLLTGLASTALALLVTLLLLAGLFGSPWWKRLQSLAAAGLAIPHLAFAIGFGFLVMPSGLLARVISGGDSPPQWITVHDPWGLTLSVALALKEVPFLVTTALGALSRGDQSMALRGQCRAAASLGHGSGSIWLRVVQPQLLRQLRWPLVIVFVYGASVVDMALILGPTQPPPLALVVWQDLNDASLATNLRGLAGAVFLSLVIAAALIALEAIAWPARRALRPFLSTGPSAWRAPGKLSVALGMTLSLLFAVTAILLLTLSFSARWPYPLLMPPAFGAHSWATIVRAPGPIVLSLSLAIACAAAALAAVILWLETQAESRDRWMIVLALVSLAVPQLVTAGGQYRLFLGLGLTGTWAGLFVAHLLPVAAYQLIVLAGPYRSFDARYEKVARSLSVAPLASWFRVKVLLLKSSLLTATAIGFAVSIAQYVPAQLIAAGRYSTLTTDAVTLSSGGSRALTAAYALALALPPLVAFALAARLGRPRWG